MSSVPLHYVDIRTFCYVTEDTERVEDALRTFLPEEFSIEYARSEGHHGDRILVMSARVENASGIRDVVDHMAALPADDLETVDDQLGERVNDNCSFFLTFDKQAAFRGDVTLGNGITVRAKVEAYPAKKEKALTNAREIFEDL